MEDKVRHPDSFIEPPPMPSNTHYLLGNADLDKPSTEDVSLRFKSWRLNGQVPGPVTAVPTCKSCTVIKGYLRSITTNLKPFSHSNS